MGGRPLVSRPEARAILSPRFAPRPEPFARFPDLMTVADVCEATGLSAQTVRISCASGELPAVKIGRRWFVPKSRLIELTGCA